MAESASSNKCIIRQNRALIYEAITFSSTRHPQLAQESQYKTSKIWTTPLLQLMGQTITTDSSAAQADSTQLDNEWTPSSTLSFKRSNPHWQPKITIRASSWPAATSGWQMTRSERSPWTGSMCRYGVIWIWLRQRPMPIWMPVRAEAVLLQRMRERRARALSATMETTMQYLKTNTLVPVRISTI